MISEVVVMNKDSLMEIFNTVDMTVDRPVDPLGELFSYHPLLRPTVLHYHDFLELGYCVEGAGVFIVDGEIIPFNGRYSSIIYAGQKHIAQSINEEGSLWHFVYIDLSLLFTGHEDLLCLIQKAFYPQNFDFMNLISYEEDPSIYELLRLIMQETSENKQGAMNSLRGLVLSLLVKHQRYMRPKSDTYMEQYAQCLKDISPVLNYINMHFMNDICLDELSSVFHCSKSTLQRKFMIATKLSPIQYLNKLRINRACILLLSKEKSILQISADVGYNSLSSFNRMFLHFMGESPSSWRKKNMAHEPS